MSFCSSFPPILDVSANDRLYTQNACGLSGNVSSFTNLPSCCGISAEQFPPPGDGCWQWCPYNGTLRDFTTCLSANDSGISNTSISLAFCQGMPTITLNLNEACPAAASQTSSAFPAIKKPRLSSILILLTLCLFVGGSTASPLDTLSSLLLPRQAVPAEIAGGVNYTCGANTSSCQAFALNNTYTTAGVPHRITNTTSCDEPPCFLNVPIVNRTTGGPLRFPRTLNGLDASSGIYDHLFGVIANSSDSLTSWAFAASTSYRSTYEYVATTNTTLNILVFYQCAQGTVTNCSANVGLGVSSSASITACEVLSLQDEGAGIGSQGTGDEAGRVPRIAFNVVQMF